MDIRPPRRPQQRPAPPVRAVSVVPPTVPQQATPAPVQQQPATPIAQRTSPSTVPTQPIGTIASTGLGQPRKRSLVKRLLLFVALPLVGMSILLLALGWFWYQGQLQPIANDKSVLVPITITEGSSPPQIGAQLEEEGVIRSATAFDIYTRLTGNRGNLQAGSYRLSPAASIPEIVTHLTTGKVDTFQITFYPGATLVDNSDTDEADKYDVTSVLLRAGYTQQEIALALAKDYDHPVFASKPSSANLEGYVFGETYQFSSGATVEDILTRTFDELYSVIEENGLIAAFASRNLSLYEGITLASIIQREVSKPEDQRQVAQVFFSRIDVGMNLGSDVTYQYIADREGLVRNPALDSPYNTRVYAGLPPGPISAPGASSLKAVGNPASGDYLFFLSDSAGAIYYAHTDEEHQYNIVNYCKEYCLEY